MNRVKFQGDVYKRQPLPCLGHSDHPLRRNPKKRAPGFDIPLSLSQDFPDVYKRQDLFHFMELF